MRIGALVLVVVAAAPVGGQQVTRYARAIERVADSMVLRFERSHPRRILNAHTHPDTMTAKRIRAEMDSLNLRLYVLGREFDAITPPPEMVNADRQLRDQLAAVLEMSRQLQDIAQQCSMTVGDCRGFKERAALGLEFRLITSVGSYVAARNRIAGMIRDAGGVARDRRPEWFRP